MLFSPKVKGFFVERNDHSWLLARTSSGEPPLTVEDLRECSLSDPEALKTAVLQIQKGRPQGNFLNATCGIYPIRRVARRATLDPKRSKDSSYLIEICAQQFRIEADKFTLAMVNAADGSEFDPARGSAKDIIFCGLPTEDLIAQQESLLQSGLYPSRIEIGTVASLGAALDYLKFANNKAPTLLLEIGNEVTHSFILSESGVEASRPIPYGLEAMIPVIQKKLSLKDEESARKLFFSNTFDFTGMGSELVQRLLKELQSSIGFYEVQTGQSISQLICLGLPSKLSWIENTVSGALGIGAHKLDLLPWLKERGISVAESVASSVDLRLFGLFAQMLRHPIPGTANAAAEKKD